LRRRRIGLDVDRDATRYAFGKIDIVRPTLGSGIHLGRPVQFSRAISVLARPCRARIVGHTATPALRATDVPDAPSTSETRPFLLNDAVRDLLAPDAHALQHADAVGRDRTAESGVGHSRVQRLLPAPHAEDLFLRLDRRHDQERLSVDRPTLEPVVVDATGSISSPAAAQTANIRRFMRQLLSRETRRLPSKRTTPVELARFRPSPSGSAGIRAAICRVPAPA